MNKKCYAAIVAVLLGCGVGLSQVDATPPVAFAAYTPQGSVTLKEYVDLRLARLKEHFDLRFDLMGKARDEIREGRFTALEANWSVRHLALEKQIEVARVGIDARLIQMNEFRDAMKDAAARYISRTEYETLKELVVKNATKEEVQFIRARQDEVIRVMSTKVECEAANKSQNVEIRALLEGKAKMEGMASQQSMMITMAISITGFMVALVALLIRFMEKRKEDK